MTTSQLMPARQPTAGSISGSLSCELTPISSKRSNAKSPADDSGFSPAVSGYEHSAVERPRYVGLGQALLRCSGNEPTDRQSWPERGDKPKGTNRARIRASGAASRFGRPQNLPCHRDTVGG